MKKFLALVLVVAFTTVCSAAPLLAQEGGAVAKQKSPKKAGLMSALIPGLGQWYNGELLTWKTAAMVAAEGGSIFVLAFFASRKKATAVCFAGAGGMALVHGVSAWDAWRSAKKINQGLALEIDENRAMVSYNVPF